MDQNIEIENEIKKIIEEDITTYLVKIMVAKKNKHLKDYIMEKTNKFPDIPASLRIYMILSKRFEYPRCVVCGSEIRHNAPCHPLNGPKQETCSYSCAQKNPKTREKIEQNSMKKYGTKRTQQSEQYRSKFKEKLHNMPQEHWDKANRKREQTCERDYGCKHVSQNKKIAEKMSITQKNFSREKKADIIKKILKSKEQKYGKDNISNQKKQKETKKNQSIEVKQEQQRKREETTLREYGVKYVCLTNKAKNNAKIARREKFYDETIRVNDFVTPLFTKEEYVNCEDDNNLMWKCKECGNIIQSDTFVHQSHLVRCLKCHPLTEPTSKGENEIVDFIRSFYTDEIIQNTRQIISPREIDIYIPELNKAIEFNGIFWHSLEKGTEETYHINKTRDCEKLGISLIHIYDFEWSYNKVACKNMIMRFLALNEKPISNYSIIKIDCDTAMKYFNINTLDKISKPSLTYGLVEDGNIVSMLALSHPKYNKKYEWEILGHAESVHYSNSLNLLISEFENDQKPKSIISYIDRRLSNGYDLKNCGYRLVNSTNQNRWFWYHKKFNGLESEMKMKMSDLSKILKNYNPSLSYLDNLKNNDYFSIYDCGQLIYEKTMD